MNNSCPLCLHEKTVPIETLDKKIYYNCSLCDLIFLDPAYFLPPGQEKNRYQQHNNTLENKGYVEMLEGFLSKVLPYVDSSIRALDFGSGPGPVLKMLLERKGIPADIYDPYFAPGKIKKKYHLITCTEVLEHIHKARATWKKLTHLLLDGGYLAIMTQFHNGLANFPDWWYRRDPTHITFYSLKTLSWIHKNLSLNLVYNDKVKVAVLQKPLEQ